MSDDIKITKCPTMPAFGYSGVKSGNDNPWLLMNHNDVDDNEPFNSIHSDYDPRNERDKIDMLKKFEMEELEEWENHFNHYVSVGWNIETPRPVMIGDKPYFSGGLYIVGGDLEFEEGKEVVADFDCIHYKFDEKLLRKPTNKEYVRHFKKHFEEFKYRIKFFEPEEYTPKKSKNGKAMVAPQNSVVFNNKKIKGAK